MRKITASIVLFAVIMTMGVSNALAVEPDEQKRADGLAALKGSGSPQALDALIAATEDESVLVRMAVAHALGGYKDKKAIKALAGFLSDPDPDVRSWAARSLGEIRDPEALGALMKSARDRDAGVRGAAIEALSRFDDPRTEKVLLSALKDKDSYVRHVAEHRLRSFYDEYEVTARVLKVDRSNVVAVTVAPATPGGGRSRVSSVEIEILVLGSVVRKGVVPFSCTPGRTFSATASGGMDDGELQAGDVIVGTFHKEKRSDGDHYNLGVLSRQS